MSGEVGEGERGIVRQKQIYKGGYIQRQEIGRYGDRHCHRGNT